MHLVGRRDGDGVQVGQALDIVAVGQRHGAVAQQRLERGGRALRSGQPAAHYGHDLGARGREVAREVRAQPVPLLARAHHDQPGTVGGEGARHAVPSMVARRPGGNASPAGCAPR